MDHAAGYRPQTQTEEKGHIEDPHNKSFASRRGDIAYIGLDYRHNHRRCDPLKETNDDKMGHFGKKDEGDGYQSIAHQPDENERPAPLAVGHAAEQGQQNRPGDGKGSENEADIETAGALMSRIHGQ